jgi:nickel/cobalt transporter (NicO) family protein
MWQIFIGSLALSLFHACIPNHWIPIVAIGKAEKWSLKETMSAALITGFAHTLSTVMIGVIIGFIGVSLSVYYETIVRYVAPGIIIILGLIYIIIDRMGHHHGHGHSHDYDITKKSNASSKWALLTSLSLAMFLTPCIEIEAYYFQAGLVGWKGIFLVSAVYVISTVLLMLLLVYAGMKGLQKFRSHTLEHHEKLITGIVLLVLGVLALFFW